MKDLQDEFIISTIRIILMRLEATKCNKDIFTYSFMKHFQNIGFCIKIFTFVFCELLYVDEFLGYDVSSDFRLLHFLELYKNLTNHPGFPSDLLRIATESTKVKDTIILGDYQFKNYIRLLNLPSKRLYVLDDNMLDSFFKNPYKEDNKYKITKYFIICEENTEKNI
jgi:hypothetical protein